MEGTKYRQKLASLVETSSWHALPNIVRTKTLLIRIMWMICFLISFAYCSYITVLNVLDYFAFNVLVNIQMVDDYESEFPAVSICNLNSIDFSVESTRKAIDNYLQTNVGLRNGSYLSDEVTNSTLNSAFCKKSVADAIRRIPNFNSYGFTIEKMLISCSYDNKPCSMSDFVVFNDSLFGTCIKFNTGKNRILKEVPIRTAKRPDMFNGFRVELFVGTPEYTPCWSTQTGALVVVHNKSEQAFHSQDGIKVAPGLENNLLIKRTVLRKLSSPYSDCISDINDINAFDSSSYRQTFAKTGVYTQKWCLLGCTWDFVDQENAILCANLTNLTVPTYTECFSNRANLGNFYKACLSSCPGVCDNYMFDLAYASSSYPSQSYLENLLNQEPFLARYSYPTPSYDQVRKSILAINIYFPALNYFLIDEIPAISVGTLLGKSFYSEFCR